MAYFVFLLATIASLTVSAYGKDDRIVGGQFVDISEFPYQVALIVTFDGAKTLCGGSIIGEKWILTAAHCLLDAKSVIVRAGSNYSEKKGQAIRSRKFIIHPNYVQTDNDIALIYLPESLKFNNPKIQPIELAAPGTKVLPFTPLTTSGWGTTSEGGTVSPSLQAVELLSINHATCEKMIDDYSITENMICAGLVNGKDTCQGDSGGPLALKGAKNILVGIISWGKGCARHGSPGVYTNIAAEREWIYAMTGI